MTPLDLGDLGYQVPDIVAVEFSDRSNAVYVLDEVFGCAEECVNADSPSQRLSICPSGVMTISASLGVVQSSPSKKPRIT
jgi:hypothetical protein